MMFFFLACTCKVFHFLSVYGKNYCLYAFVLAYGIKKGFCLYVCMSIITYCYCVVFSNSSWNKIPYALLVFYTLIFFALDLVFLGLVI